jgi:hypothetical protein
MVTDTSLEESAAQPVVCWCLHLIDATGRHYVFNIDQAPITMLVNQDQFVWNGNDNNLHGKFVDLYHRLMVEKQSICVMTPSNSLMLGSDKIAGVQLSRDACFI